MGDITLLFSNVVRFLGNNIFLMLGTIFFVCYLLIELTPKLRHKHKSVNWHFPKNIAITTITFYFVIAIGLSDFNLHILTEIFIVLGFALFAIIIEIKA